MLRAAVWTAIPRRSPAIVWTSPGMHANTDRKAKSLRRVADGGRASHGALGPIELGKDAARGRVPTESASPAPDR
jgi:hypothetical protein